MAHVVVIGSGFGRVDAPNQVTAMVADNRPLVGRGLVVRGLIGSLEER